MRHLTRLTARVGVTIAMLALLLALAAIAPTGALAAGNAAYTTFDPAIEDGGFTGGCVHGSEVNCNTYASKQDVYLNGGPTGGNGLANGEYFFAVLAPGCQNGGFIDGADGNLSDTTAGTGGSGCSDGGAGGGDPVSNRTFTVNAGAISAYGGTHATGTAENGNEIIAAFPYDDTPNPGGVYILAICPVGATSAAPCKFDAFKVKASGGGQEGCTDTSTCPGLNVVKDANPAFTREFNWKIEKSVDACRVTVVYPNGCQTTHSEKTLNYTVTVTKDEGTDGGWEVSGTISILNASEAETATGVSVSDVVTDPSSNEAGSCDINGSGGSPYAVGSLAAEEALELPYVCTFSSKPAYDQNYTNTATVEWDPESVHSATGSESFKVPFQFKTPTSVVHDSVSLADLYTVTPLPSGSATLEGALPSGTISSSQTYKYSYVVKVPHDCLKLENTASFTVADKDNDADDTESSSVTVKVCRTPANTGALTMGFWQNKNGQGIIGGQAKSGTCPSATWLRQFHPFSDLPAASTCSQVATYVYNVIKAASCTSTAKTCNAMLKAQMLATALDVYFSDPALGGNKIGAFNGLGSKQAPIGSVTVDLTQICAMIDGSGGASCSGSYENVSSAFGGATSMTVLGMLSYQNTSDLLGDGGASWYGQLKATQVLAKDAFDAINNGAAFAV
ncbi:MAG TPA: hypothetical protein VN672_05080 [Solirubrobacteraceae bacterium]|nr:hypothetical protein [Solirubrobacteraceae bacterium]